MSGNQALLVIDLQRGGFDGQRCPPIDAAQRLIGNATTLIDAARAAGTTVVFVRHVEDEAGSPFETGTIHAQLHEALVPADGDLLVEKRASSSFEGTPLQEMLQSRGVTDLVLCGLQSEFCVTNTARSALALGYGVQVPSDAHGTWPSEGRSSEEIRAEVNARLAEAGVTVAETQAVVGALA